MSDVEVQELVGLPERDGPVQSREVRRGVLLVILIRPDELNAMNAEMIQDLRDVLDEVRDDAGVRAIVLTGAGRAFCAGLDLRGYGEAPGARGREGRPQAGMRVQKHIAGLHEYFRGCRAPIIGAVNGAASGGGMSLSLFCDIRLMSSKASLDAEFIKRGVGATDVGASWLLPRMIGFARAADLLLTGRAVTAQEALELGLASSVHEPEDLLDAAMDKAEEIAMAMAALTMDHLSGGGMIVGLGVSGPQVVEGWYGPPYPRPLERTREYVEIMRKVWAREEPVRYDGKQLNLPYRGDAGAGLGKPLKSTVHPLRADIPVYLGAEGPKNVAMSAEIADGWLPLWFSPKADDFYRAALDEGFSRTGARRTAETFDIAGVVWVSENDDIEVAAAKVKPTIALYAGGISAVGANFHNDVFVRMGWGEVCADVQSLFLAGRREEAVAAVPLEMVEDVALIGPADKLVDDLKNRWANTCLTTLVAGGSPRKETLARLVEAGASC
jgi:F420-dependent oxidoreductase-like protein